jgi:lipopolysaccharide export system protein LptA
MKSALLVLCLLVFAGVAGGQTGQTGQTLPSDREFRATADSITQDGNVVHLRGHVELRRGPSVISADEADLPARVEVTRDRPSIELRGNVKMTIEDRVALTLAPRK